MDFFNVLRHSCFTIIHLLSDISPPGFTCFQDIVKCKQTSVCLSKLHRCASKVHLSSWKRRQKPARIKQVGLWPTLTFSALSTRNGSAPSSNTLCDISRAGGGGGGGGGAMGRHATQRASSLWHDQVCFGFTSRLDCTWAERKRLGGRSSSRSLQLSTTHNKVFRQGLIVKLPWN